MPPIRPRTGTLRPIGALRENGRVDRRWEPAMASADREAARADWHKAVARTLDWT